MVWQISNIKFQSISQNERIYIGDGPSGSKVIPAPINSDSSTTYSITNVSNNIQIVQPTSSSSAYLINISPVDWNRSFMGKITAEKSNYTSVSIRVYLERVSKNSTSMMFRFTNN
jgi:hypothetical protein